MPKVAIRRSSYNYEELRPQLFEILDYCSGFSFGKGSQVVIKPNLLSPAAPETAVLTHPLVVRAAAEYVISKGAKPSISDSPAMGSFDRILKESGIKEALADLDVEYREFKTSISVDIGEPFGRIDMAEDAIKADVIINLAKLKTHSQMLLTLGVKNNFGCIVGFRKPEWHMRTGVDRNMFARLLVQIHRAVNPSFTIIDGILAMEGEGPGKGGTPRHMGVLLGSDDAIAVDTAVCWMLGIKADQLFTNKAAKELGLSLEPIRVDGELPIFDDFSLPEITSLSFGPQGIQKFLRQHLFQRPAVNDDLCISCGECWNFCPVQAVQKAGESLSFDYERCIRCYCCIEVCPQGALHAVETLTGKLFRKIITRG
jgi:uncharacterized protein (DUF362 family)/Pyruvate/2-oxoacid:ferredoxin oxidoreductase delta subunit